MKTIFKIMFYTIAILLFAWITFSFLDVVSLNNCGGTNAWWNFFVIFFS